MILYKKETELIIENHTFIYANKHFDLQEEKVQ